MHQSRHIMHFGKNALGIQSVPRRTRITVARKERSVRLRQAPAASMHELSKIAQVERGHEHVEDTCAGGEEEAVDLAAVKLFDGVNRQAKREIGNGRDGEDG